MEKHIQMDDPSNREKTEGDTQQEDSSGFIEGNFLNVSDVLPAIRLRRFIQISDGYDWLLLGCRHNFLWGFRIFLVVLYCTYAILK
jgi:hypothetical protein